MFPNPTCILLFLALAAYGQMQERVAILNTVDNHDSIGFSDLIYLTDRLRETAVKILPKQRYGVMTTESIVTFLGSEERAVKVCKESSCLAEVGRKVNADYVAQARVGRFGKQLSINFQLYNTKSGNLMDSFTGNSNDIFGLLAIIDEKAPTLFKQMIEESKPQKKEPEPTPIAPPIAPPIVPVAELPKSVPLVEEVAESPPYAEESDYGEEKVERKLLTFGVMAGINLSHITLNNSEGKSYGDAVGVQLGAVADFAPFNWFRIQPGIMYIQKGLKDKGGSITAHYFELPLLLSLKISAFRLNIGPYFGYCLTSSYDYDAFESGGTDFGLSAGIGYDMGKFSVGVFYDLGFPEYSFTNRTLGFNFGVNL